MHSYRPRDPEIEINEIDSTETVEETVQHVDSSAPVRLQIFRQFSFDRAPIEIPTSNSSAQARIISILNADRDTSGTLVPDLDYDLPPSYCIIVDPPPSYASLQNESSFKSSL